MRAAEHFGYTAAVELLFAIEVCTFAYARTLVRIGAIVIVAFTSIARPTNAQAIVTVDDLVYRAQIPLAALSFNGRFAAYLIVRGNASADVYDVEVRVVGLSNGAIPKTIDRYQLAPSDVFNETEELDLSAGVLHWTADNILFFTTRCSGKARLMSWGAGSRQVATIGEGHDRIEMDDGPNLDSPLVVRTTDFIDPPEIRDASGAVDHAWRIRDSYRFYGPLKNPTTGRWAKKQKWSLATDEQAHLRPLGSAAESWDLSPDEWQEQSPRRKSSHIVSQDSDDTKSPDGTLTAIVEDATIDVDNKRRGFSSARIVVARGAERKVLVPFARPRPMLAILGWNSSGTGVYFISIGARDSSVNFVALDGIVTVLHREIAELQRPGLIYGRKAAALSRDGSVAILVRSTNVIPGELVGISLVTGQVTVLDSPNEVFLKSVAPQVRFYEIDGADAHFYGRLYLPVGYKEGTRYPLVVTQYISRPGYYAGVGDEVPILPLSSHGIAVFAMHSREANIVSDTGDFQQEINRVRAPMRAMTWITSKLETEGIVDPKRIALHGLSYGAEIAMYAYWKSHVFRTISVATTSWDPSLMLFGGLDYASYMERRGFPILLNDKSARLWRTLSAGLNARTDRPPILIQSPDAEEMLTVPTWFQLRRAGAAVEWYEYPHEGHVKRSPANKWWVYTRNLDWFRFWLKDEEDKDLSKQEQYTRWRALRRVVANVSEAVAIPNHN